MPRRAHLAYGASRGTSRVPHTNTRWGDGAHGVVRFDGRARRSPATRRGDGLTGTRRHVGADDGRRRRRRVVPPRRGRETAVLRRPTACARTPSSSTPDQGVVPGFRELLRRGAKAADDGLLTQAPPNTGAGWYTLATGAWPGVHGSTNNTFHVNGQPFANTHVGVRPRRAAGRDARPGGRAGRHEGRPDRVGRRPRRRDRRADARLPQLPLRARRGDELHLARRLGVVHRRLRAAVRPSGRVRRAGAVPAGRAAPATSAGPTSPRSFSPPKEMRLRVLDFGVDKYGLNAYIYDSTQRRPPAVRPRAVLDDEGRRRRGRRPPRGRVGRRQGHDPGRADLDGKTGGVPPQGRAAGGRPLAGAAVPHVGDPGDRHVADVARRARLHRRLRGLRRRALPVVAGRRLRRPRGGHRQRGDVRRAGPVLGEALPPADRVRPRHLPARPGDGRLPGHRRVPAPVPRPRHPEAAQRRAQPGVRRRPGQRHARRPRRRSARRSSAAPTRAPTPRCAWPSGASTTAT